MCGGFSRSAAKGKEQIGVYHHGKDGGKECLREVHLYLGHVKIGHQAVKILKILGCPGGHWISFFFVDEWIETSKITVMNLFIEVC